MTRNCLIEQRKGNGTVADCSHHSDCYYCPLYHAAHDPAISAWGCDDGELGTGECAVTRGTRDYAEAIGRLAVLAPRLVAGLRFKEEAATAGVQRSRNLRLASIH
jgi:hypothetical protein